MQSRDKLIRSTVPLVKKIAQHLIFKLPYHICIDDLIQSGLIGLIEAADNYDPSKGASFSTYASIRVRGAMIDEMRRGDWAPRSVHRSSRALYHAMHKLESQFGSSYTNQQLALEVGVSIEELNHIIQDTHAKKILSYDESENFEHFMEMSFIKDTNIPLEDANYHQQKAFVSQCIGLLPIREKMILILYYRQDYTLKQIGAALEISESRVSQILSGAVSMLKQYLQDINVL
jgi:RNA polymerase sigma factor for flagellar operon FliA